MWTGLGDLLKYALLVLFACAALFILWWHPRPSDQQDAPDSPLTPDSVLTAIFDREPPSPDRQPPSPVGKYKELVDHEGIANALEELRKTCSMDNLDDDGAKKLIKQAQMVLGRAEIDASSGQLAAAASFCRGPAGGQNVDLADVVKRNHFDELIDAVGSASPPLRQIDREKLREALVDSYGRLYQRLLLRIKVLAGEYKELRGDAGLSGAASAPPPSAAVQQARVTQAQQQPVPPPRTPPVDNPPSPPGGAARVMDNELSV